MPRDLIVIPNGKNSQVAVLAACGVALAVLLFGCGIWRAIRNHDKRRRGSPDTWCSPILDCFANCAEGCAECFTECCTGCCTDFSTSLCAIYCTECCNGCCNDCCTGCNCSV
ncbi:hypothetical protein FVEN_g13129 [Fusarium venenatum]|nr:hypothetical protein FVEN_g13129 [Fusarium venenatum]